MLFIRILDSAIGIILGCVPAIRSLWKSERLGLIKSLRSAFSSTHTPMSGQAVSESQLHTPEHYGGEVNSWVEIGERHQGKNIKTTRVTGPTYDPETV